MAAGTVVCAGLAKKLNFKLTTKVLSCLSLLTQLLALVTPYWMEVGSPGFETNMGLWNMCINWSCSKLSQGASTRASSVAFEVGKALMTFSTLLGFLAVCSVLMSFHTFRKYKVAAVTNILTGIFTLMSVLVLGLSFSTVSANFHPEMRYQRSVSFYMACLASFLFFLSGLMSLITHIHCPETPPEPRNQVPPHWSGRRLNPTAQLCKDQPLLELPPPV